MYAITGVTGHVGGATARALLDAGAPVRGGRPRPGEGPGVVRAGRRGRGGRLHRPDGADRRAHRLPRRVRHAPDRPDRHRRRPPAHGRLDRGRGRGQRRPARGDAVVDRGGPPRRHRPDPLAAPPGEPAARDRRPADRAPVAALPGEGRGRPRRGDRRRHLPGLRRLRRRPDPDGRHPRRRRRRRRGPRVAAGGQRGRRPGGTELHRAAGRRGAGRRARPALGWSPSPGPTGSTP